MQVVPIQQVLVSFTWNKGVKHIQIGGTEFFFWLAIRRFILVKMGTRNIPRRKGQSILIIIGLMLSSTIVATSLGIGDTVRYSIRSVVLDSLGTVDERISGPGKQLFGDEYFDYSEFEYVKKITSLLIVSDKDYKKANKVLKGIIHIHFLLQKGI